VDDLTGVERDRLRASAHAAVRSGPEANESLLGELARALGRPA